MFSNLQLHLKKNLNFKIRTQIYLEWVREPNLLINLFGTIQINEQIGTPIEIWVPLHILMLIMKEQRCTIVYIVPDHSKGWYLKPNNNVDTQGCFTTPI